MPPLAVDDMSRPAPPTASATSRRHERRRGDAGSSTRFLDRPIDVTEAAPHEDSVLRRRCSIIGFVVSALFHLNLLLVCAATYTLPTTNSPPGHAIESALGVDLPDVGTVERVVFDTVENQADGAAAPAPPLAAVQAVTALMTPDAETDTVLDVALGGGGAAGGDGKGNGDGNGVGRGEGDGRIGFFGTAAAGERFVFIVDCSQSMEGERFARARRELIKTLLHFNETQEVYVFFFSDRAVPMFSPHPVSEPVKLDRLTRAKLRRWISNRGSFGGTNPDEALQLALQMKPDVVYLLSDGEFPRTALTVAHSANKNGAVIHTIAFGYRGGEPLLKAIAEEHKGRYRFVP